MGLTNGVKLLRVAFIDIFGKNRNIPMGQCFRKDYTHGELTSGVLRKLTAEAKPEIDIFPVKTFTEYKPACDLKNHFIKTKKKSKFEYKSLLKQLKKINKSDKHYDYVNISNSHEVKYTLVDGASPETISNPDIQKTFLGENGEHLIPDTVKHIIQEIEKLTSGGTKVYVSSCNSKVAFNAFSLAKGVHTVSGKNAITNEPIKRFSINSLVDSYQPLPVYMTTSKEIEKTAQIKALKMNNVIRPDGDYAKLSHFELSKKIASKKDYEELKAIVDDLWSQGRFVFDLDFMRFKLPNTIKSKKLQGRIFEIDKFKEIFKDKFSDEIMQYTFPMGTHCDLSFRQFFDMKSKSKCIMPITKTTRIPNTASGTSFAAPQALAEDLMKSYKA